MTAVAVGFKGCGPHLLEHDALAVRRATERVALELSAQVSLLIALLRPPLLATHGAQLARRVDSTRLTCGKVMAGGSAQASRQRGCSLSGLHNRADAGSLSTHARASWPFQVSGQSPHKRRAGGQGGDRLSPWCDVHDE